LPTLIGSRHLTACGSDSGGTTGPDPVATSLSVSPPTATLDAIGATAQFVAVVLDQNGQTMSGALVTWASSDPSVLTIDGSSGLATATSSGEVSLSATSGSASGSASVTVRQVPVQVQLSLAVDQLSPGSSTQATLTALDAGGHAIPSPAVVWGSGSPEIASIDGQGEVTAVSHGLVHIKGTMESLADSTVLSVSSALDGDQLTTLTDINGVAAVFTSLGGGTHFQLLVEDGSGQPLMGAVVQYADVDGRALFAVEGAGNGYAPAFLFGPIESLLAFGEPLSTSELPENGAPGGFAGPQTVISQATQLRITLPLVSSVQLSVVQDALHLPTFLYDPAPVAFGIDGPFRGRKCMTWESLVQHQKNRLGVIPGWTSGVTTLSREASPSFFDPAPAEGRADVYFATQDVLVSLTGEDLLAEKINLLGAMAQESAEAGKVEVTWEFGDGGPAIRQALGWYGVRTNDRYCGGDLPETLTTLTPELSGEPSTPVNGSVRVQSVWGNSIPSVDVAFSLTGSDQGSLPGGGLEATRVTDENGIATVPWTLPSLEGSYILSASVARDGAQPLTASMAGEAKVFTVTPTPTSIATGSDHTCGLTPNEGTYCWGLNAWGELGVGVRGAGEERSTPDLVFESTVRDFQAVAAGRDFTCALDGEGRPFCWGRNDQGQLGSGTRQDAQNTPRLVEDGFQFAQLVSGQDHTCGLTPGGLAYCWGGNDHGQLGNGIQVDSIRPGPVAGGLQFQSLAAGGSHTCGVSTSGAAYCWGSNQYGALGDGTLDPHLTPNPVLPVVAFSSLTTGGDHTCGQTASGQVYCWGRNNYGQLGIGSKVDTSTPTQIAGGISLASVDAGGSHSCGVTADGSAYCWGRNHLGQIGDGSLSPERTTPSKTLGQHSFSVLKAGPFHTCGLTADGTAYCWGDNSDWQLGQGASPILFSNSPLDVKTELKFGRPPSS